MRHSEIAIHFWHQYLANQKGPLCHFQEKKPRICSLQTPCFVDCIYPKAAPMYSTEINLVLHGQDWCKFLSVSLFSLPFQGRHVYKLWAFWDARPLCTGSSWNSDLMMTMAPAHQPNSTIHHCQPCAEEFASFMDASTIRTAFSLLSSALIFQLGHVKIMRNPKCFSPLHHHLIL